MKTFIGLNLASRNAETRPAVQLDVTRPGDLSPREITAWNCLLIEKGASPFLSPGFVSVVAEHRSSVKVIVVRQNGEPVGFIPVDVVGRRAQAVGLNFADFQGVVLRDDVAVDEIEWLEALGVRSFHFDHLLEDVIPSKWAHRKTQSPYMDLSRGFSHYENGLKERGTSVISQVNRKRRKLSREVGELRFDLDAQDTSVLEWIIQRKHEQRIETRSFDVLKFDWVVNTLRQIQSVKTANFSAATCALYAGDRLVAAHFSLRTKGVMHYWFTAYAPELGKYSPGLSLLLMTAEEYARDGVTRLDLGRGGERYKQRLATGSTVVLKGAIDLNPVRHSARRCLYAGMNAVRESRYAELIKRPFRSFKNAGLHKTMGGK